MFKGRCPHEERIAVEQRKFGVKLAATERAEEYWPHADDTCKTESQLSKVGSCKESGDSHKSARRLAKSEKQQLGFTRGLDAQETTASSMPDLPSHPPSLATEQSAWGVIYVFSQGF